MCLFGRHTANFGCTPICADQTSPVLFLAEFLRLRIMSCCSVLLGLFLLTSSLSFIDSIFVCFIVTKSELKPSACYTWRAGITLAKLKLLKVYLYNCIKHVHKKVLKGDIYLPTVMQATMFFVYKLSLF